MMNKAIAMTKKKQAPAAAISPTGKGDEAPGIFFGFAEGLTAGAEGAVAGALDCC